MSSSFVKQPVMYGKGEVGLETAKYVTLKDKIEPCTSYRDRVKRVQTVLICIVLPLFGKRLA